MSESHFFSGIGELLDVGWGSHRMAV